MFARFLAGLHLRHSTAFLLLRQDDHLLRDIGLTRDELQNMHLGLPPAEPAIPARKSIPLPA